MKSKTIILSNSETNSGGRGILTLFQEDELLKCRIRLYNTPKLDKYCKIGIYHKEQVFSANLLEKNGSYESSMVGDFNLDEDFYSAIINTNNSNEVILSGGTYGGYYFNNSAVFNDDIAENEPILAEPKIPTNTQQDEPCEEDCSRCATCKYKEYFYSSQEETKTQNAHEQIQETKEQPEPVSIVESILPQFEYVFENYEANSELNTMLPNSKFVKMNENNSNYSIGAIYEEENLKYICYAVKCNYNTPAPEELGTHYQWLPLDKEDPLSEGYYIVFQDANDLKIVEL